jgi:predicted amidohydrolase
MAGETELLTGLTQAARDGSWARAFVELWEHVEVNVQTLQTAISRAGEHAWTLSPPVRDHIHSAAEQGRSQCCVRQCADDIGTHVNAGASPTLEAARWLRHFGAAMEQLHPRALGRITVTSTTGRIWRVASRDPERCWVARADAVDVNEEPEPTGPAVPPTAAVQDLLKALGGTAMAFEPRRLGLALTLRYTALPTRLDIERVLISEGSSLRVLLRPLRPPDFVELPPFVRVVRHTDQPAHDAELDAAFAEASDHHVLVLPELCVHGSSLYSDLSIDDAVLGPLRRRLDATRSLQLVLVAFTHQSLPDGTDVNEAILLARGHAKPLIRHRKLHPFTDRATDLTECLTVGEEIHVLATPIGNLAVLICVDLLVEKVKERVSHSPASVLFAPSLSPESDAHDAHAKIHAAAGRRVFVANTWRDDPRGVAGSLVRTPEGKLRAADAHASLTWTIKRQVSR